MGRLLLTVLFTDIVGSTETAARIGDRRWRGVLDRHDALIREALAAHGGREIDRAGDGFFAAFEVPTDAIRCAHRIARSVDALGVAVRQGIHTGECEPRGMGLSGIAVHVAARVSALAEPGEVLASSTVKDLSGGAGISFAPRGTRTLKGVPGRWRIYSAGDGPRAPGRVRPRPASRPASRVSVMLVDDHPIWRQSLRRLIGRHVRVVAEAADGGEVVEAAMAAKPDVVVMDIDLPTMSGIAATAALASEVPSAKVLIMSSSDQRANVLDAVRAGASGYLLKTAESPVLLDAIKRIHAGEVVFPPALAGLVLEQMRTGSP